MKIIDMQEHEETCVDELICVFCHDRAIHTWPKRTYLKELECGKCGQTGGLIATGCERVWREIQEAKINY